MATTGVRFDPNQILMSSSVTGDILSLQSAGGNNQGRGLYAGKYTMNRRQKKKVGSKNCLVS